MFIREGQLLGSKAYFPKVPNTADEQEVFESFFLQFYLAGNKVIPKQIVLSNTLTDEDAIADVLASEAG
jgi:excinuclease ABC subunit C